MMEMFIVIVYFQRVIAGLCAFCVILYAKSMYNGGIIFSIKIDANSFTVVGRHVGV